MSNSKLYIFRGQPNKEFFLQPSVFRDDGKKKLLEDFPCELELKWHSSEEIKKIIDLLTASGWKINERPISTLFNFTFYMFQYNYKLAKYVRKHPEYIDIGTLTYFNQRPSNCWTEDKIFYRVFSEHLIGLIGRFTKDRILKESEMPNTLTI